MTLNKKGAALTNRRRLIPPQYLCVYFSRDGGHQRLVCFIIIQLARKMERKFREKPAQTESG